MDVPVAAAPSIFPVNFYEHFAQGYQALVGKPAASFQYIRGETPLSTNLESFAIMATYFVVIFGGQAVMKNFNPIRANLLFQIHNFLLTVLSAGLLVLFVEQIYPILSQHGVFYSVCNSGAWTQPLELLYYLNYLTKYYELIDTVFLVLRKKKLEFLHYYHHSLTMLLCFTQLNGRTAVSYVPITLNLAVHVLMYYYYWRASCGVKIWWKKYLTIFQITQFIIDLGFVYFCAYTYFTATYFPHMPNMGSCTGTESAAIFGCALLSSYLLLFIQFFLKTYTKKPVVAKKDN
ncbi:Fatty acyl-CoA elongase/Polyunsaturated fatty acid specific elongation enzyme [Dimargaris cristalligena]|uniref:Elongation of fatty acids protein n=1 Tax=Dimargaris cristalligena TaxID=215637 RepID=A0A4P9ZLZ4_9FUNG|nr:Fatty acyl-CoA elongase/Polyunsaturated fatty acid specific elongation enzyme [Dimargaris cristalligena]RKP33632.1 ELO family [Dimargaris cristalligena]|eukprot:RKP33632.1 ELO family [Dimargaris cristalligena]